MQTSLKKDDVCYVSVLGPGREQKVLLLFYFLMNNNKILH